MHVLLVTSWDTACGIADYARALKESVEAANPEIEVIPSNAALDPLVARELVDIDLLHLNHHDALHSRWTPEHVREHVESGTPVLVTYHDSRSGASGCENSDKLKAFAQVASSVVVHEPVEDVKAIYWRQGVPAAAQQPMEYHSRPTFETWTPFLPPDHYEANKLLAFKAFPQQPVLGTVGFNFPWKNFDRLAQVTAEEGWALVLLSTDATPADEARWRAANSSILVVRKFLPQATAINYLAGCDATAFMYECQNNGTSGAIRQGIAARKPVIAHQACRQFRDLYLDPLGRDAIQWVENWEELRQTLRRIPSTRFDPTIHALAERDSWRNLGREYARLYRLLVEGSR